MDTVQLLGSATGLGFLAGVRLYATVFALGAAIRLGWFELSPTLSHLSVVGDTPILVLSGMACVIEFLADKIPWLDSLWDAIHTFIRPVGAAALGATAVGSFSPSGQFAIALLCGGVALSSHSSKAAARLAVNHSPEPFSNVALSVLEDSLIPLGVWLSLAYPLFVAAVVVVFLLLFAIVSPRIYRWMRMSYTALRTLLQRSLTATVVFPAAMSNDLRAALSRLSFQALPEKLAKSAGGLTVGLPCGATASVPGLKNATGYLCVGEDGLHFITRRMLRARRELIRYSDIEASLLRPGLFVDRLLLKTGNREIAFDLFRSPRARRLPTLSPSAPV
jgi:hypothetical protein